MTVGQFVGEIRIFAGNFAPAGWALCNGQLIPISQNTALFSLLGTNFGGDGRSNFALPNLQGAVPRGVGQGPGLSPVVVGEQAGETAVTLLSAQLPSHSHAALGVAGAGNSASPAGASWAEQRRDNYTAYANPVAMSVNALAATGGGQAHNNLQPYLALSFIIALTGIYPPRS
jgi:microcystin-dependent protein